MVKKTKAQPLTSALAEPPAAGTVPAARWGALGVGLTTFTVYALTLAPSLPGGDAGELIVVAMTRGIAHPPGYPLYTLLASGFALLPLEGPALRINLLSALCGAGAATLLYLALWRWSRRPWAAVFAAGLFAFSPRVWEYATGAEVFALNNLLVASMLYAAAVHAESPGRRGLLALAGLAGLGIAHHHTSLLVSAPLLLWAFSLDRRLWTLPTLGATTTAALLGLSPYLYLPLAAHFSNGRFWGSPGSVDGFVDHFLRREYGTFQLASGERNGAPLVTLLASWLGDLWRQTLGLGLLAALVGARSVLRRGKESARAMRLRSLGRWLLASWAGYGLVFHALANLPVDNPLLLGVLSRFWQQPLLLGCAFAGLGVAAVSERTPRWAAAGLALALTGAQLALHASERFRAGDTLVRDFGRALLEPLPPGAVLLARGDVMVNATSYAQTCDGVRPDVQVVDVESMTYRWYLPKEAPRLARVRFPGARYHPNEPDGFSMRALLDANAGQAPVFLAGELRADDPSLNGHYELRPFGLSQELVRSAAPPDPEVLRARSEAAWSDTRRAFDVDRLTRFAGDPRSWEHALLGDYWQAQDRMAVALMLAAHAHGDEPSLLRRAIELLEQACERDAEPSHLKNLGLAYAWLSSREPAEYARALAAWRRYLDLKPQGDADLPTIRAAVEPR